MSFRNAFETMITVLARLGTRRGAFSFLTAVALMFSPVLGTAQTGTVLTTPHSPMELPIEVEIELSPAGSLKQAALWKELYQLLKNPNAINCPADNPLTSENESYFCTSTIPRRDGFGATMPALRIYSPGYNFLTAQPLRRRTSDGEVSWDQPGPLFDPAEDVALDAFTTPTRLRTPVGALVACPVTGGAQNYRPQAIFGLHTALCDEKPAGSLVVSNPTTRGQRNTLGYGSTCTGPGPNNGCSNPIIPPNGTIVAVSAFDGVNILS